MVHNAILARIFAVFAVALFVFQLQLASAIAYLLAAVCRFHVCNLNTFFLNTMGILGLAKLIADVAPNSIKERELKHYFGMFYIILFNIKSRIKVSFYEIVQTFATNQLISICN